MDRRDFIKLGAVGGAIVLTNPSVINQRLFAHDGRMYESYEKVQLVDDHDKPIKVADLVKDESYIFQYPHKGTPCILLNLGEKTNNDVELKEAGGEEYIWSEGVGPEGMIVAYSAICSHALTHPNKSESFFTYVPKGVETAALPGGGAIVCSSHLSAFDAKNGGKVMGGPADQPLASIVLEHNAKDDSLWAVGVLGGDKFHDFFSAFKTEMKRDWGGKRKAKKLVKISVPTVTLAKFTKEVIQY
ncbi:MAG: Rieske 2Fe-2S domain-containing protein [Campylobacterota bacterium]|nr:Rieske 2Fe-2S domain-containing protein [Campylobacterota bacterium]